MECLLAIWPLQKKTVFLRSPSTLNPRLNAPKRQKTPPLPLHLRWTHEQSRYDQGLLSSHSSVINIHHWSSTNLHYGRDEVPFLNGSKDHLFFPMTFSCKTICWRKKLSILNSNTLEASFEQIGYRPPWFFHPSNRYFSCSRIAHVWVSIQLLLEDEHYMRYIPVGVKYIERQVQLRQ